MFSRTKVYFILIATWFRKPVLKRLLLSAFIILGQPGASAQTLSALSGALARMPVPPAFISMFSGPLFSGIKFPPLPSGVISDPLSPALFPDDIPALPRLGPQALKPPDHSFRIRLMEYRDKLYLEAGSYYGQWDEEPGNQFREGEITPEVNDRLFLLAGEGSAPLALDARPESLEVNELPPDYSHYLSSVFRDDFWVLVYRTSQGQWLVKVRTPEGVQEMPAEEYRRYLSLYFDSLLALEFNELSEFTLGWNTPGSRIPLTIPQKKIRSVPKTPRDARDDSQPADLSGALPFPFHEETKIVPGENDLSQARADHSSATSVAMGPPPGKKLKQSLQAKWNHKTFSLQKNPVADHFICPLCLELLNDPLSLCDEQHMACSVCVKLITNEQCPCCRAPLKTSPVTVEMKRVINLLPASCDHCPWQGSYGDIAIHATEDCLETFMQSLSIQPQLQPCPFCKAETAPDRMAEHYLNCPEVSIHCPNTPCSHRDKRRLINDHLQVCSREVISCTIDGCGQTFKRYKLQEHMDVNHFACPMCHKAMTKSRYINRSHERFCPKRRVLCVNHKRGCAEPMTWDVYKDHQESCGYTLLPCPRHCSLQLLRKDLGEHLTGCQPGLPESHALSCYLVEWEESSALSAITLTARLLEGNIYQATLSDSVMDRMLGKIYRFQGEPDSYHEPLTRQFYWFISQDHLARLYRAEIDVLVSSAFTIHGSLRVVLKLYYKELDAMDRFQLTIYPENFPYRKPHRLHSEYARVSVHNISGKPKEKANDNNPIGNLDRLNDFNDYEALIKLENPLQDLLREIARHPDGKLAIGFRLERISSSFLFYK